MARFDFFNVEYSLEEIEAGITDDNIANFKNDEEFLEFLIYYSYGEYLEGDTLNESFKEKYAQYHGILNLALLDQYDIRGKKLYTLYEICGKDKMRFIRVLHHIGRLASFKGTFTEAEIITNLALRAPVDFIDEAVMFPDGKNHEFGAGEFLFSDYKDLKYDDELEYNHELRRSLIKRINQSIITNSDDIPLLEEIKSYKQIQEDKDKALEEKRVKDDYEINVNNLYYGKETLDSSGGVLNFNMGFVTWFEDTGIKWLNYFVFRSVPKGDYCLIDSEGKIFIPNEPVKHNGIDFLPNTPIRAVQISNMIGILENGIKKLEESPIENEIEILNSKGILEQLNARGTLSVSDLNQYESLIRMMYEELYGPIFPTHDEEELEVYPKQ